MNIIKTFFFVLGLLIVSFLVVLIFPFLFSWLFCFILPTSIGEPAGAMFGLIVLIALIISLSGCWYER